MRNKRLYAILFAAVLIAGVTVFWWVNAVPPTESNKATSVSSNEATPQASVSLSPYESQLPGGPYQSTDPRWEGVHARDKVDRAWEWKIPISFYGRVLDENEKPVPAAKIHAQWSDLTANGASNEEIVSDSEGFFSVIGKIGRGITVRVSKEGYYTPKQQISFDYAAFWEASYHRADPNSPVVFYLRTKKATQSLSVGEVRPIIPAGGTPVRLDLLDGGRISHQGQLEIAAVTNTEKYPPRVFDWRASIEVLDGGLLEHDLEFPFEAPEGGYVSKIEFRMSASSPDWRRSIEKAYFIRMGTPPKYGRLHVRFNGASQHVSLNYALNPSGSRNLESNTAEP